MGLGQPYPMAPMGPAMAPQWNMPAGGPMAMPMQAPMAMPQAPMMGGLGAMMGGQFPQMPAAPAAPMGGNPFAFQVRADEAEPERETAREPEEKKRRRGFGDVVVYEHEPTQQELDRKEVAAAKREYDEASRAQRERVREYKRQLDAGEINEYEFMKRTYESSAEVRAAGDRWEEMQIAYEEQYPDEYQ